MENYLLCKHLLKEDWNGYSGKKVDFTKTIRER